MLLRSLLCELSRAHSMCECSIVVDSCKFICLLNDLLLLCSPSPQLILRSALFLFYAHILLRSRCVHSCCWQCELKAARESKNVMAA